MDPELWNISPEQKLSAVVAFLKIEWAWIWSFHLLWAPCFIFLGNIWNFCWRHFLSQFVVLLIKGNLWKKSMTIGRSLEKGAGEARIVRKVPKEIKKNKGSIATAQACLKMVFKTQQFETVLSFFILFSMSQKLSRQEKTSTSFRLAYSLAKIIW